VLAFVRALGFPQLGGLPLPFVNELFLLSKVPPLLCQLPCLGELFFSAQNLGVGNAGLANRSPARPLLQVVSATRHTLLASVTGPL
jgi:hypothetical protein